MARPELLDVRPMWGGGKMNATTVSLEPLTEVECERLIANLLGAAELPRRGRRRIVEAAEGNPLFVEEMLAMLIDDGLLVREDGPWVPSATSPTVAVPPSIQALLGRAWTASSSEERAVIERAAVIGKVFYVGAGRDLVPEDRRARVRPTCWRSSAGSWSDPSVRRFRAGHVPVPAPAGPRRGLRVMPRSRGPSCTSASRDGSKGSPGSGSTSKRRSWPTTSSRRWSSDASLARSASGRRTSAAARRCTFATPGNGRLSGATSRPR